MEAKIEKGRQKGKEQDKIGRREIGLKKTEIKMVSLHNMGKSE